MSLQPEDVPAHEIIVVPGPGEEGREELKQQCFDLRMAVFAHEQGFPEETEIEPVDEDATHILLRLVPSLKPVGTIRVTRGKDYYKLARLVVIAEYRKYKFGRKLVEAHKEWVRQDAKARGLKEAVIHCSSQLYVIPFYAKFGYVAEGEEYDDEGAPHKLMKCKLAIE